MAEMGSGQMTGSAGDWLAWLTDPKAPMPGNALPSVTSGQTFGNPNAASGPAFQPITPDTPPLATVNLPGASPGVRTPAPPTAVNSMAGADAMVNAANPNVPPAMSPAPPVNPRGDLPPSHLAAGWLPPRIPTPGQAPEAKNTSNLLDSVLGIFGYGPRSVLPDANAATPAPQRTLISPPAPPAQAAPSPGQSQGAPPGPAGAPPSPSAPGGPPPVAMGTGPGSVPHDQAAALAGGAANLGTKVAQDPNTISGIIDDLRTKGYADNGVNAWMALANAGFATMASRSPFVGQAIGEGAQAGLASYQAAKAAKMNQAISAANLMQRQQQDAVEAARQKAEQTRSEAETGREQQLTPSEIERNKAEAVFYGDRGNHYNFLNTQNPSTKAEQAAFQKEYDRQLAAMKANPPATMANDPAQQAQWGAEMATRAYQETLNHPERWQNGGLPVATPTSLSPDALKQQANAAIAQWNAQPDSPQKKAAIDAINARLAQALGTQ